MTPNAVGEPIVESPLLAHDWHKKLDDVKLAAYVRYQFIWQKDNAWNWDTTAHSRRRPSWDGGKDQNGINHKSHWGEIVRHIHEQDAYPGMWVHAHFSSAAELRVSPATAVLPEIRPNMLHARVSAKIYYDYANHLAPAGIWRQYEIAGSTIRNRFLTTKAFNLQPEEQQLYVLCDETYVTAPPFFRHAFAAAGTCDEAIETYLWLAALDYEVHQPIYDALMAQNNVNWWVTDNIKAAVIQIREHWENYYG